MSNPWKDISLSDYEKQWVSDSPYIHAFDRLDRVHCQIEKNKLTEKMNHIGYKLIKKDEYAVFDYVCCSNGKQCYRI